MLRTLALLLIAANLAFLGWSRGWLDGIVPWPSTGEREPQRLQRQVRPDAVVLHPKQAASAGAATLACLETEPMAAVDVAPARRVLAPLLPSERVVEVVETGGAVMLRIDRADEALAAQLLALRADAIRGFRRCAAGG